MRNDNHHKATTAIAKSAGRVVVETLNVSGMIRNRRLARGAFRCWHVRLPIEAGVQVRVVRHGVREGGPVVRLVEAVRALWLEERQSDAVRSGVVVRRVWRIERTRLQRCGEFRELAGFELPGVRTWRLCKTGYAGGGR